MKKKIAKHEPKKEEVGSAPADARLVAAFQALASMPEDFFAEGRFDPSPEDVPSWDDE
jgi:hypothetical protein